MKFKIQNSKFKVISSLLLTACYLLLATSAHAQVNIGQKFGFGNFKSLGDLTSNLVRPIFSLAASLVVLYFLWGAFKYIISGGNKEAVAEARGIITHAIIGFIILIFAFLILQFLLFALFGIKDFQIFQTF